MTTTSKRRAALWMTCLGFAGLAAFYLLTEHLQHTLGALPYALLLACPALHLLGHRHGASGDAHGQGSEHA
jgi:hypothetical protein